MDLDMKHKNHSSQSHSKISLQRFETGEARDMCVREWEVFLRLEMEFTVCSSVEERGRSKYI
jgi:hypothetical protein